MAYVLFWIFIKVLYLLLLLSIFFTAYIMYIRILFIYIAIFVMEQIWKYPSGHVRNRTCVTGLSQQTCYALESRPSCIPNKGCFFSMMFHKIILLYIWLIHKLRYSSIDHIYIIYEFNYFLFYIFLLIFYYICQDCRFLVAGMGIRTAGMAIPVQKEGPANPIINYK